MSESKIIFEPVAMKGDPPGEFSATFSTFNRVDRDSDVTLPGAFTNGAQVPIGVFNHGSVKGDALPVGVGTIRSDARRAWVEAAFLDTPAGRTYHATLKALGPLTQWSYSYEIKNQSTEYRDLQPWPGAKRILKALSVIEVAPVMRGAGIDTQTDWVKSDSLVEIDDEFAAFAAKLRDDVAGMEAMSAYRASLLEQMRFRVLTSDELEMLID